MKPPTGEYTTAELLGRRFYPIQLPNGKRRKGEP